MDVYLIMQWLLYSSSVYKAAQSVPSTKVQTSSMRTNTILITLQLTGAYIQVHEICHQDVMVATTMDVILIPLEGKQDCGICVCLALRIMHAIAINWATVTFPLLMLLTFRLYFQIILIGLLTN